MHSLWSRQVLFHILSGKAKGSIGTQQWHDAACVLNINQMATQRTAWKQHHKRECTPLKHLWKTRSAVADVDMLVARLYAQR